eukprot:m51a1_g14292 putative heat shock protein sti-like (553) ;mRNA; r:407189-409115
MADEAKRQGNEAFARGDNKEAIRCFSEAIALDAANHILYSNRSAAHAADGDYAAALADAEKTVSLKPDWAKGYGRKGTALHFLGRFEEALAAFKKGLEIDPSNEQLRSGAAEAEEAVQGAMDYDRFSPAKIFSADYAARLRANPSTAAFLDDPAFVAAIEAIRANPQSFEEHVKDQRIMTALAVLMGINVQPQQQREAEPEAPKEAPKAAAEPQPQPQAEPEAERPEPQREAEREKEAGNEAYKAKRFEEAVAHYTRAMALWPDDPAYRSNLAAVYLEMGDAARCVEECRGVLEDCKRVRQYKLVPKVLTRMGNAHSKLEQWPEAIECYQKSLTENRNADTLQRLQRAEAAKKRADEAAYLSPELSLAAKNRGNELFKAQQYPEAIKEYSEAVKRNPRDHVPYSNRAACYMKLGEFPTALKDAEKCLELCPDFVKGHTRKAACHFFMKEYHKAIAAYDAALKLEPGNQECLEGMQKIEQLLTSQQDQEKPDEEQLKHAMADPEIRAILQDPVMQQVINDLSTDPKRSQHHLRNQEVMAKINKLVAAGILRMK